MPDPESFAEYRLLILKALDRLDLTISGLGEKIDAIRTDDISTIKTDVALLKLQASLIGAASGGLMALAVKVFSK